MARAVDDAMEADSKAKAFIRRRWVQFIQEIDYEVGSEDRYMYVSLPGRLGKDLEALREAGILEVTEAGSLTQESQKRFAAIERSGEAVADLQRRFIGLKIYEQDINDLLRGTRLTRFPDGANEDIFKAAVINLDFDAPLRDRANDNLEPFPILGLIRKIATIHKQSQSSMWGLCITFNSTINWEHASFAYVGNLIETNCNASSIFRNAACTVLGEAMVKRIATDEIEQIVSDHEFQQKLLSIFVPKRIAELIYDLKWRMLVDGCFRYKSVQGAPMASWIIKFSNENVDNDAGQSIYLSNIAGLLEQCGEVTSDGIFAQD